MHRMDSVFHMRAPGSRHSLLCILQKQDILRAVLICPLVSIRYIPNLYLVLNTINDFAIYVEKGEGSVKNDCLIRTLCGIVPDVPGAFYVFLRSHSLALQIGEFTLE